MSQLVLSIGSTPTPELLSTRFTHALLPEVRLAVRGRTSLHAAGAGTFQWTYAVQALTVLLLRSAAEQLQNLNSVPVLEGLKGSPAASLDFALTKLPDWLVDVFGRDSQGNPLCRRIIHRSNSGLKHSGPVVLSVAKQATHGLQILVEVDGALVSEFARLNELAERIQESWDSQRAKLLVLDLPKKSAHQIFSVAKPAQASAINAWEAFSKRVFSEVSFSLRSTDIFTSYGLRAAHREVIEHPSFVRIVGSGASIFAAPEMELLNSKSFFSGYFADATRLIKSLGADTTPIRVAMGTVPSGVTMLFSHLSKQNYNIFCDSQYSDAAELVFKLEQESFATPPDLITLGIATAAQVLSSLGKRGYRPLMLIPKHSARILGPKRERPLEPLQLKEWLNSGRYLCHCETPSSATFYLDQMRFDQVIQKRKVKIEHATPDKIFQALREGEADLRVIVHFPHHHFNTLFNNSAYMDSAQLTSAYFPGLLFAHESFLAQKERVFCLTKALRNSWLSLRDNDELLSQVVDSVLNAPGYKERLSNFGGISNAWEQEILPVAL